MSLTGWAALAHSPRRKLPLCELSQNIMAKITDLLAQPVKGTPKTLNGKVQEGLWKVKRAFVVKWTQILVPFMRNHDAWLPPPLIGLFSFMLRSLFLYVHASGCYST